MGKQRLRWGLAQFLFSYLLTIRFIFLLLKSPQKNPVYFNSMCGFLRANIKWSNFHGACWRDEHSVTIITKNDSENPITSPDVENKQTNSQRWLVWKMKEWSRCCCLRVISRQWWKINCFCFCSHSAQISAPPLKPVQEWSISLKTKGRHSRENGSGAVKKQTPAPSVETDCVFTPSQLLIVIPSFYATVGTV